MSERKPPDVGLHVRAWRQQRGLSMRGLAELCDLSPNTISLIERGSTSPSVSTLHRLATALKVPITAFFEDQDESIKVIVTRPGERTFSGSKEILLEALGSGLEEQTLEPFVVTLKAGADSGSQPIVHDGHEFVYCLEGVLEYEIDDQHYQMSPGESLLFDAHQPHGWGNPSSEPTVFLLIFQSSTVGQPAEHHLQV